MRKYEYALKSTQRRTKQVELPLTYPRQAKNCGVTEALVYRECVLVTALIRNQR